MPVAISDKHKYISLFKNSIGQVHFGRLLKNQL